MNSWAALSNNAKSVIEWVECPREKDYNLVTIRRNEPFIKAGYCVNIPISSKLFDEIKTYVEQDGNLETITNKPDMISFCFTEKYISKPPA